MRTVRRKEPREFVVSSHDLLVQVGSLGVFEGEEAAHHCVEDDSAAPYVTLDPVVLLSCDHLWSGIAWGAAGGFEHSVGWLIQIAEAEVDDFESFVEIKQQVLWLEVPMADSTLVDVVNARD